MPPPPGNIATRVSFAGMYSFQFQGWLRAHDESGHFLTPDPASRPRKIETAVVMAGFQSPPDPPNPNNPDTTLPLPRQNPNTGYYPFGALGIISYASDNTVQGHLYLSIGGNISEKPLTFTGRYQLKGGIEGNLTLDASNGETVRYYFVMVDGDREIVFMSHDGTPNADGRYAMVLGVQKLISG